MPKPLEVGDSGDIRLAINEGAFDPNITAYFTERTCSICGGEEQYVMAADSSDGEYGGPAFCCACLEQIVAHMRSEIDNTCPHGINPASNCSGCKMMIERIKEFAQNCKHDRAKVFDSSGNRCFECGVALLDQADKVPPDRLPKDGVAFNLHTGELANIVPGEVYAIGDPVFLGKLPFGVPERGVQKTPDAPCKHGVTPGWECGLCHRPAGI